MRNTRKQSRGLIISLYIYWMIQVIVQNIFKITSASPISLIIKAFLIIYLIFSFVRNAIKGWNNILVWVIFVVFVIYEFISKESSINGTNVIYYLFPLLFSFLIFVVSPEFVFYEEDLYLFFRLITISILFFCLYSLIFQFNSFTRMLSLTSAYGYELTSIFFSNYEFGMYLTFGIVSAIICYQKERDIIKRIIYSVLVIIFLVNLIATFSRTSILALIVIISVFILFSKNNKLKFFFVFGLIVIAFIIALSSSVRSFIELVLLKGYNDADRYDMWDFATRFIGESPIDIKLFGSGYSKIYDLIKTNFNHGGTHNAFLQTILIWGFVGFAFLVSLIIFSIIRAVKIFRINKKYSLLFIALSLSSIVFMFTATSCLMTSTIESYFLTIFTIVIPRYLGNYFLYNYKSK